MINKIKDIIYNLLFREKIVIYPDESLRGKTIVITGASRGIGRSTAEVLLNKGAFLTLVARNTDQLQKTYRDNPNCLIISADVTSRKNCIEVADQTIKSFGKIDVLINSVGLFIGGNIEEMDEDKFDLSMDTNVKGVFLMSTAVIPFMKKTRKGLIINLGSKISHNSNIKPGKVIYATTKYAVEGFSYALGKELQPFGIRVTCLMPATVKTFRSLDANKYLSPYRLGEIISMLIKYDDIHFEGLILKSDKEDI